MVLFLAFGIIKLTSLKTFSLVNVHSETYHTASMSFNVYRAWNKKMKGHISLKLYKPLTLAYDFQYKN